MALSYAQANNAKPQQQQYKLTDSAGLYLLIHPNGSKYWRLNYRFNGKQKTLALGVFPTVPIVEAREKRDAAKKLLSSKVDPAVHKHQQKKVQAERSDNTFASITSEFFNLYHPKWSAEHLKKLVRRMELHALPMIGKIPVAEIKRNDVLQVLRAMEAQKKWHQARRVLRVIYWVLDYAVMTDRAEYNAAVGLSRLLVPYKTVNYPTLKPKEIPDFCSALRKAKATDVLVDMVRVLMLTIVRQQELRLAHWHDIDLKNKVWTVRAETTKMKRPHVVPLSPAVVKILRRVKELNGDDVLVFPALSGRRTKPISENTINALIKRIGYEGKIVGHGFRAMASTVLNEKGFRSDAIEAQLAHIEKNQVRGAYNRAQYMDERRDMMQWWSNYLVKAGL